MLKMKSVVSAEVNGRSYEMYCQPDSPLPDALEAWSQINAFLLGKQQQQQQAQKASEPSPEEKAS